MQDGAHGSGIAAASRQAIWSWEPRMSPPRLDRHLAAYLAEEGYLVRPPYEVREMPDSDAYTFYVSGLPVYHPWRKDADIATLMADLARLGTMTLIDWDRMWTLKWAFAQTTSIPGEVWEAGVYRGGSALMLKRLLLDAHPPARLPRLRLFDSFEGLPVGVAGVDLHSEGDFSDTSLEAVTRLVGTDAFIDFRKGWIPNTFAGLSSSRIRLAHIDVDIYQSTIDCCEFIYSRMSAGGVMLFDDYGFASCPGARKAVDEFFADKPECPLAIPTGQAVVFRVGG
jgi:O-methyltransferase